MSGVGREGDLGDGQSVRDQLLDLVPGRGVPEQDGGVFGGGRLASRRQEFTVWGRRQRIHFVAVPVEFLHFGPEGVLEKSFLSGGS